MPADTLSLPSVSAPAESEVSWRYYVATGVTAMIACFMSAVQGDVGVFFRVREILILIFKSDVHPLWVFVPAFLMGVAACWVEKPKNSRSVLVAGLASFSLFGFAPYTTGPRPDIKGMNRKMTPTYSLVVHPKSDYFEEHVETVSELNFIIRTADFQVYQRGTMGLEGGAVQLWEPGHYQLEIIGGTHYRNTIYTFDIKDKVVELEVVLERVDGFRGFFQKFFKAARSGRLSS